MSDATTDTDEGRTLGEIYKEKYDALKAECDALRTDVEMLRNCYKTEVLKSQEYLKMLDAAKSLNAVLRKALKPFAHPDLCVTLGGNAEGDKSPVYGRNTAILRLGDFRKARAALANRGKI